MALAVTSSTLYIAQRRRLRGKRRLAQAWFLGKSFLGCDCCMGLAWGIAMVYPLLFEAAFFRVQTLDITGLTMLTRAEVVYLLGMTEETTLWQLDLPRLGARLTHHPYVKSVALRREFPNTLRHRSSCHSRVCSSPVCICVSRRSNGLSSSTRPFKPLPWPRSCVWPRSLCSPLASQYGDLSNIPLTSV